MHIYLQISVQNAATVVESNPAINVREKREKS